MLNVLREVAHKVTLAKDKQSQKQKAEAQQAHAFNGRLSKKQIDRIVAAVNRGEITLPDLKSSCEEDFITVWALADTGSVPGQKGGEAQRPRGRTDPGVPTPEEYNRHMLTHLPYRRWCRYCVMARMRNEAHLRLPPFSRSTPLLVAEYGFVRSKADQDLLVLMW